MVSNIFISISREPIVDLGPFLSLKFCLSMYNGLLLFHSVLRWLILLLAIIVIFRSVAGMMTPGRAFSKGDRRASLFLMIAAHTTLVVGLYLWCFGPWGLANIQNLGFGGVMKDRVYRFYAVEHSFGMLVAIAVITAGAGAAKRKISDASKFKRMFWCVLIALILILATIPWPFMVGIARPLL
jgi:hypothetical protein